VVGWRKVRSLKASWLMTGVLAAGLGIGAAACASAAAPIPEITATSAPNGPAGHSDSRITLPITIRLSFQHPSPTTRTEHEVLYTVQQALRSELHAEYGTGTQEPLLPQYWAGSGLASAESNVAAWMARDEQPVGVLEVTGTSYQAPNAAGSVSVSYCASWSDVLRGDARTHEVSSAVQGPGTPGIFTVLTLARATDHRWRVTQRTETVQSPRCAVTASPPTTPSSSSSTTADLAAPPRDLS
jgi:hypothetical protein